MEKMYQTEWFDIKFSSFIETSTTEIASNDFYDKFYRKFYDKYNSYMELPELYRNSKDELVEHILQIIKDKKRVLSIGSGNGYIEYRLSELLSSLCSETKCENTHILEAIEPSVSAGQWFNGNSFLFHHGYFPEGLNSNTEFDFAYASTIDYVFDDDEYVKFMKSVVEYGIKDFLLTDVVMLEKNPIRYIKAQIKKILAKFFRYDLGQFWGYLRTIDEHKVILRKVGFNKIDVGKFQHGSYWIRALND